MSCKFYSPHLFITGSPLSAADLTFYLLAQSSPTLWKLFIWLGIHYMLSAITKTTHQTSATHLIISQCLLPHVFTCVADTHKVNIQDLAPSNTHFKLFVFPRKHTQEVAAYLNQPECIFFSKRQNAFDIILIIVSLIEV
jgi:Phenol hydroxylase, C-terminal dimerisation domain